MMTSDHLGKVRMPTPKCVIPSRTSLYNIRIEILLLFTDVLGHQPDRHDSSNQLSKKKYMKQVISKPTPMLGKCPDLREPRSSILLSS